jgi:uncharacterized protein DUF1015
VYLGAADAPARIARIQGAMQRYLAEGLLVDRAGPVLVERTVHGRTRRGLMLELDLEHYDFSVDSTSLIRPTEGTMIARLAPRIAVRRGAPLELPHILVLIDDPSHTVIGPLAAARAKLSPLYDTELMGGGGHVAGHAVDGEHAARAVAALRALADRDAFAARYGVGADAPAMLFAVGDGNHSLAAARLLWERLRARLSAAEAARHPARLALVELVNLHDPGLVFEPIHRAVFGIEPAALLASFPGWLAERGARGRIERIDDPARLQARLDAAWSAPRGPQAIGWTAGAHGGLVEIERAPASLPVGSLQAFLDAHVEKHAGASIDYIHGADVLRRLVADPQRLGFFLPALDKRELFRSVILDGALPRKTFSMGEADEKRFYLEARRILPAG